MLHSLRVDNGIIYTLFLGAHHWTQPIKRFVPLKRCEVREEIYFWYLFYMVELKFFGALNGTNIFLYFFSRAFYNFKQPLFRYYYMPFNIAFLSRNNLYLGIY